MLQLEQKLEINLLEVELKVKIIRENKVKKFNSVVR